MGRLAHYFSELFRLAERDVSLAKKFSLFEAVDLVGHTTTALVAKAHTICPYSNATKRNIAVKLLANGKAVEGGAK